MESKPGKSYNFPHANGSSKSSDSSPSAYGGGSGDDVELIYAEDRPNWGSPVEFILACMNFALGLGNIWRYPYLAYRNGGGAFLIPYFLALMIIGIPIFFAELVIGQYSGLGPIKAFANLAPIFKGLGYCTLLIISYIMIYYFVIVAWVFYYFYQSFFPNLPWGRCDLDFSTDYCYDLYEDINVCQINNQNNQFTDQHWFNRTCQQIQFLCTADRGVTTFNGTHCQNLTSGEPVRLSQVIPRVLSAEEFYYSSVLGWHEGVSWTHFGYPRWQIFVCLFIAWFLCGVSISRGVKSVGKIVYFTATFPFLVLTALLIRGVTLPGAIDGIWFYIQPDWERLLNYQVWGDASSQIFFSFSLAVGSLIAMASYNKFKNNIHFDVIFISLLNYCTALYAGFAIFSILGFLAYTMGEDIDEVVTSGPGLTFIVFPSAVLLMPGPQIWALLFFFMMIILGLGSTFAGIQMVVTSILDNWPHLRKNELKVVAATCFSGFLLGLPMTSHGGILWFTVMDRHSATWAILIVGFLQVIILSWVYGFTNTFTMIEEMGMKISWVVKNIYWRPMWIVITPFYTVAIHIFILSGTVISGASTFKDIVFPWWADMLGWMLGASTLIPFLIFAVYEIIKTDNIRNSFKPTKYWGPQETPDGRRIDRARMVQ